ncbi:MAG: glycosyltransferase family 39 protein [Candidatus Moranbacteria bacterium]|jgi:hypothetical protein|nr:glycosyltransferase family 39 protein [Candidatus Moranbacteria bacterium]
MQKLFLKLLQKKYIIFVVLSVFIFFSFGLSHLTHFVSPDEQLWKYERIPHYWKGLFTGELKKTYINDKPGITLALVDGAGYFLNRNLNNFPRETTVTGDSEAPGDFREQSTIKRNFFFRMPLLVWSAFMLLFFYWILNNLTANKSFSSLTVFLIATSPVLVGISQTINPDALIWSCTFASVLLFFAFIIRQKFSLSILSGVFLGLSLLCKYTSTFLFIYFFALIIIWILFFWKYPATNPTAIKKYITRILAGYAFTILTSLIIFIILLPAALIDPEIFLKGTVLYSGIPIFLASIFILSTILIVLASTKTNFLLKILGLFHKSKMIASFAIYSILTVIFLLVLSNWSVGNNFLHIKEIPFDVKFFPEKTTLLEKTLLEFEIFIFSLQPIIILLLLTLWVRLIFDKKHRTPFPFISFSLSFFILSFFGAVISKNLFAIIRYDIILYPAVYTLAAISFYSILSSAFIYKSNNKKLILLAILIISMLSSITLANPFYSNYTSVLLPKKYAITDSWGYGGFEAAQYLNSLPDAKKLTVWSDYYGVCEFFSGICSTSYSPNSTKNPIDYYIITRRGEIRYLEKIESNKKKNKDTLSIYSCYGENISPEWELNIDNRPNNFIRVIPASALIEK